MPFSTYLPELQRITEAGAKFILVAGQAVNFWAERYQSTSSEFSSFSPFVSKDVDLFGSFEDLYAIPKVLDGELKRFKDMRTPVMGVFKTNSEPILMFELLRGVYGPVPTARIVSRAKSAESISVIDPLSLLISKAHNAAGIDQDGRQDVRHVKMMVLIVRAYFSELCGAVGEQITARQFINECKYLLDFASEPVFLEGLGLSDCVLADCFPLVDFAAVGIKHDSVARFAGNTLSPAIGN